MRYLRRILVSNLLFWTLTGIEAYGSNDCQADVSNYTRPVIIVSYSELIKKTVSKTAFVFECCPGYINASGTFIPGCGNGTYGANCSLNCSCDDIPAFKQCDYQTGYCLCLPGKYGPNCSSDCTPGHYGSNCSYPCTCENNATCTCTDAPGWTGIACGEQCPNDTYGPDCNINCTCNVNQTCDHVNGTCSCEAGHTGENCSEECANMTYGENCAEDCQCQENTTKSCDPVYGTCVCKPGYIDLYCRLECDPGWYNDSCHSNCSDICVGTNYCHHETGLCICLGNKGENCSEECANMTYGANCAEVCQCQENTTTSCNRINGTCKCKPGYTGINCSHKCDPGLYGDGCNSSCSDICNGTKHCHHETGQCICMGKKGENCSEGTTSEPAMGIRNFLKNHLLPIVLGGVGLVLVIAVTIAVCCYCRRRKLQRRTEKEVDEEKTARGTSLAVDNVEYIACNEKEGEITSNGISEAVEVSHESKFENSATKTGNGESSEINEKIRKNPSEEKLDKRVKGNQDEIGQRKDNNAHPNNKCEKSTEDANVDDKNDKDGEDDYAIGEPDDDTDDSVGIYEDADVASDDDAETTKPEIKSSAVSENDDYDYGYHDKSQIKTASEYNTFEEIRKMRKSVTNDKVVDAEEEYDHLENSVRKVSVKKCDQEAYSTVKNVRSVIVTASNQDSSSDLEEDDTYNTLESDQKEATRFSHPDYNRVTIDDKIAIDSGDSIIQGQRPSTKRVIVGSTKQSSVYNKLSAVPVQPVRSIAEQAAESDDDGNYPFCEIQEEPEQKDTDNLYEHCTDDDNDDVKPASKTADVTKANSNNRAANYSQLTDEAMSDDEDKIYEEVSESSDTDSARMEAEVPTPKPAVEPVQNDCFLTKDNATKLNGEAKTTKPGTSKGKPEVYKTRERKLHDYEEFELKT